MRKRVITALAALVLLAGNANAQFGFGGQQIDPKDMHCSEKFVDLNYADDGLVQHSLDVYIPEKKADKYPVVIHIYGSAWFNNNGKGMADLGTIVKAYLNAGYAVVCPNHRASTEAKWPAQCHDIKAVIRWVRGNADKYHFDSDFIATSGFSSGAHLSSFMGATTGTKTAKIGSLDVDIEGSLGKFTSISSAVSASVVWSGPIDMENMDCAGKKESDKEPEMILLGCPKNADNHDRYASLSPIPYLDSKDAPTIVFHGTADNVVPHCQGVELSEKLKAAGIRSEFYSVEGGGHGFNMYSDVNLARAVNFLNSVRNGKSDHIYGDATEAEDFLSQNAQFASHPDPNFYIYLCIGQSNMEGPFPADSIDYEGVSDRFLVMPTQDFNKGEGRYRGEGRKKYEWDVAVPPLCRPNTGLSCADYFGRTMVENLPDSIKVGVIHVAIGGCKIEHLFKEYDPAEVEKEAGWFQNFMRSYDNFPYLRLIDCALRAQKQGVIKGILLHQGCSNTGDPKWPAKVNKVYNDILRDLSLKAEDCPLVAGELVYKEVGGRCSSHNPIINQLPSVIKNSAVVSAEGLTCQPDGLHFSLEGFRVIGKRYAEQMMKLNGIQPIVKEEPAPAPEKGKGKKGGKK